MESQVLYAVVRVSKAVKGSPFDDDGKAVVNHRRSHAVLHCNSIFRPAFLSGCMQRPSKGFPCTVVTCRPDGHAVLYRDRNFRYGPFRAVRLGRLKGRDCDIGIAPSGT